MVLTKKIDNKKAKNTISKVAVCYIYQKSNSSFWENIDHTFKNFNDVFVINISNEEFKTNRKNLKILNLENNDFNNFVSNYFLTKKSSLSHLIFLESNEKIIIESKLNLNEDNDYNIKVKTQKQEVHDYSISPFIGFENRIINLKRKDLKETLTKFDLYPKKDIATIIENQAYILKSDFNSNFEIIKSKNIDTNSNRSKFFKAVSNFYVDSSLSEKLFKQILNSDIEEYKFNSFSLLIKLLLIRQENEDILKLASKNSNYIDANSAFYLGQVYFNQRKYSESLKYFHQSIKLKRVEDQKDIPYFINEKIVYNYSDISFKLYKSIALLFYEIKRYKSSQKYFEIALTFIKNQYSPEIDMYLGRIKFNKSNYGEAFEIFNKIINNEETSKKILKELKQPLINLMMFLSYRDEFLQILSKEFIDNQEDILRVADTYYMTGDFINALQLYILSVERFGFDQKLLFKLGYISSMLRSLDQAVYYFEKFLEKDPDNLTALNNLAFIYLSMEKADLAEKYYLKIINLNNYSYEANLYLSVIYISQNEKDKAEEYLEKARILNPTSSELINLYKIFKKEFY